MKRVAALLLLLMVLPFVCIIHAEGESTNASYSSLKDMTTEELINLRGLIGIELQGRGLFTQEEIQDGTYVVGTDIKAGNYEFAAYTLGRNGYGEAVEGWLAHYVYDKESESYITDSLHYFYENDFGTPVYLTLKEGEKIEISCATLYAKAVGVKSWQP